MLLWFFYSASHLLDQHNRGKLTLSESPPCWWGKAAPSGSVTTASLWRHFFMWSWATTTVISYEILIAWLFLIALFLIMPRMICARLSSQWGGNHWNQWTFPFCASAAEKGCEESAVSDDSIFYSARVTLDGTALGRGAGELIWASISHLRQNHSGLCYQRLQCFIKETQIAITLLMAQVVKNQSQGKQWRWEDHMAICISLAIPRAPGPPKAHKQWYECFESNFLKNSKRLL